MKPVKPEKYIGRTGFFNVPIKSAKPQGFAVPIKVIGAKLNCNRVDLTVAPIGGTGFARVKLVNITLDKEYHVR